MSSSIHTLLKTKDSLQPIFPNENNTMNSQALHEDNEETISCLGKLKDDSAEDICFPDFQNGNAFLTNAKQVSPSFNHEAGSTSEKSPISEKDGSADMSGENRSSKNANNNGVPTKRESSSSASSHQIPGADSRWNPEEKTPPARQRPLRSSSAQCASAKRQSSPCRKGRGSYVCTKPKNKRNQRR
ncbi:unnamed protein product [Allacma fusca]|uniref:Uncharacterized protein n=1 Tax=Allacma fusca TaxID=39272 RepID=A0A8J2JIA7_9HEXA|nr:unnamed protein product [Allacma fusca]